MKDRIILLLTNIKYTFTQETAHWANNWGNILSTCFYTLSHVLFINVIYSNVNNIAGYSKDELLLFMLIGQIGFYLTWLIHGNLDSLIRDVNSGTLDLLLVKPVPHLFYVTFKKVRVFSILRDCLPPLLIMINAINWNELSLTIFNVVWGFTIVLMGIVCMHVIHFLAALPVFWLGESSSILELTESAEYNIGKVIPLEGFQNYIKIFFLTIFPALLSAGLSTSVMLGKSSAPSFLILVFLTTVLALSIRKYAWEMAVKNYTSASS